MPNTVESTLGLHALVDQASRLTCADHSTGNIFIYSARAGASVARPLKIASTEIGANSVSLSARLTCDGLIFSAFAIP